MDRISEWLESEKAQHLHHITDDQSVKSTYNDFFQKKSQLCTTAFPPQIKSTMKILLDVKDNKADFLMELLGNLPFVKTKTLTSSKAQLLEELKEAVENMTLVKQGKLKARPAKELLDEL